MDKLPEYQAEEDVKTGWRYLSAVQLALKSKMTAPKFNGVVVWLVVWGEGS